MNLHRFAMTIDRDLADQVTWTGVSYDSLRASPERSRPLGHTVHYRTLSNSSDVPVQTLHSAKSVISLDHYI